MLSVDIVVGKTYYNGYSDPVRVIGKTRPGKVGLVRTKNSEVPIREKFNYIGILSPHPESKAKNKKERIVFFNKVGITKLGSDAKLFLQS